MNSGKEQMMDFESVARMLGVMCTYWPNFTPIDGQVENWTEALKTYTREEAREAMRQFRAEEDRNFAPNISNLIGRMDILREIESKKASDFLLLDAPPERNQDFSTTEEYAYKTSRTTPKRNKDDSDHETRKAIRCTPERRKQMEEHYKLAGLVKFVTSIGNGRYAVEWKRK